ncbi:hypothetical protein M9Y10_041766 [Tritrichomonas musculus]|uniref:Uncharacterized protein n=1 Tax=Tritrichomonas musculus TaxID=1915356 RepID=A0ABR2K5C0_9EUKA
MQTLSPKNYEDPVPTIFVKLYENRSLPPKKVLIPKRMVFFIENCQRIFHDQRLQSVVDGKGLLIESIRDLAEMKLVYLTIIDPAFCKRDPNRRCRSPESKNVSTKIEGKENVTPNEAELQEKEKKEKEEKAKNAQLTKKSSTLSTDSTEASSEQRQNFTSIISPSSAEKKKKKIAGIKKIDMRKISRPPSSSDDDDDDEDDPRADMASMSTKLSSFLMQHEDNSSDEESEELRRHKEEKRRKKMMFQSIVTIKDPKNVPFQQLIEEIIPPQEAPRLMEDGINLLASDRREFIQKTSDLEGEQLYLWIKGAADQPFLKRYPMQPYHDPITGIVTDFLIRHRFISNKQYTYRFKGAVIGPKKSGKSTLLGNAVDNYILDLAATGVWKSTFILAIDFKPLSLLLNDYVKYYYKFIDIVVDAISKQKPILRAHITSIRRQLRSAVENRAPIIGVHPYRDVDSIVRRINEAWRSPYLFTAFLTNMFLLPVTLAKALGFTNISLFVDNIEYADVNLIPHDPFDSRDCQAIVIEHIKYALNQANFILSAEKSEKLFQLLPPFDEDGVDLSSGIDYITPYEATSDLGSRLKYDFLIECAQEPQPMRLTVGMCGGVVPFIAAWDELHHSLFVLERTKKDSDQYDEVKFACIADAQTLVDLLFVCEEQDKKKKKKHGEFNAKITVIGVKRDKRGQSFQLHYDDNESEQISQLDEESMSLSSRGRTSSLSVSTKE